MYLFSETSPTEQNSSTQMPLESSSHAGRTLTCRVVFLLRYHDARFLTACCQKHLIVEICPTGIVRGIANFLPT